MFYSCADKKSNKDSATSTRETRTVDVQYILDIQHEGNYKKYSYLQDITTTCPGMIQDITINGDYDETIKGLTVREGSIVKLAFEDATDCDPADDCIYTAILAINVDGVQVANGRFNCSNGNGSGSVEYTFE